MKDNLKATVVDFSATYNFDTDWNNILNAISEAKDADIIVFPEELIGFPSDDKFVKAFGIKGESKIPKNYDAIPNKYTQLISAKCRSNRNYVALGCLEVINSKFYNTLVLFTPNGELHKYYKTHLVWDEPTCRTPGSEFKVVETTLGKIGLLICFDIEYPEAVRITKLMGAEVILASANWAKEDREGWELVTRARARENQVFILYSGRKDNNYINANGESRIVGPTGKVLAQAKGNSEPYELVSAVLDANEIRTAAHVRGINTDFLKGRRPELYKKILE